MWMRRVSTRRGAVPRSLVSQIAPFGNPTPRPPSVPVPEFNAMGLIALIGILIIVLVTKVWNKTD